MRTIKLEKLATELRDLDETAQIKHLDANKALVKFLVNVHDEKLKEIMVKTLKTPGLAAFEELSKIAVIEMDHLDRKWCSHHETHDPRFDVSHVQLPSGPDALDALPWPIHTQLQSLALEMLDRSHAVTRIGAKTAVVDVSDEDLPMMTVEAFNQFHAHRRIEVDPKKGKTIPLTKTWQGQPARKTRGGIVCDFTTAGDLGDKLNVFRGFPKHSVPAKSCQKFLDFIRDVICDGNAAHYSYVIAWLADIVQNPHRKSGVCLVLRSEAEGTGKSFFGKMVAELFGKHSYIANSPKELLGSFNAHMAYCLFCVCNEVLWGGDHESADALKAKITEGVIGLERKGFDTVQLRNSTRYVLTSNNTLPVAAGEHSRRYFVLDVSTAKKGDTKYFADIADEMEDGGFAALMEFLQGQNLSADTLRKAGIDLWRAPQTKARTAVAVEAAPIVERFVMSVIATGGYDSAFGARIDFNEDKPTRISKKDFKDAAKAFTQGRHRGDLDAALTKALNALDCGVRADLKIDDPVTRKLVRAYDFPLLKVMRDALVKKWGEGVLEAAGFEGVTMDTNEVPLPRMVGGLRLTRKGWTRRRGCAASLHAFKQRVADQARERAENDHAIAESATDWHVRQAATVAGSTAVH